MESKSALLTQRPTIVLGRRALWKTNGCSTAIQTQAQCAKDRESPCSGAEIRVLPAAPRATDGASQERSTIFNVLARNRTTRPTLRRVAAGGRLATQRRRSLEFRFLGPT